MGHVQRPTWSGASRPLAECSILLGGRIPDLVHHQSVQHSKGHRRLSSASFPPTAFNLSTVTPVTSAELRRIILESPPKSCELDPLPTSLLQEFVDVLLPFLTVLCNRSIQDGILPASQKRSILVPALKCEGLDSKDPVNYRPIANVSFVSKIIEKIIAFQMTSYLETNNLLPDIQSGFRKGHSTKSLLLRLLSDVYAVTDSSQLTLLALFDVSAAFDTVDHEILLKRLNVSFGLSGTLLLWLRSYLTERSLCVVHGSSRSFWVPAPFGHPQGSVLAPLLFIIYTSDFASLLASHALLAQLYADDVQAYQHCRASDAAATARAMSIAMEALGTWMSSNRLRFNSLKTKFIWLGTRQQLAKLDMVALAANFPHFIFSSVVRDLGVTLDQELTFAPHLNSAIPAIINSANCTLLPVRLLPLLLLLLSTVSSLKGLTIVAVSTLHGLPATRLSCLDHVLRSVARLIGRTPKYDHISTYMRDILHRLPARQRIEYRVAALVWRCLLGLAPAYLVEFCGPTQSARSSRSLRSADRGLLRVPFARTSTRQSVPLHWVVPQFGMASLCRYAHSLERFLRHSFLNLRRYYLVVLGLGAPLSSPT